MPQRLRKLLVRWTAPTILFALAAFYTVLVVQYDHNLWGGPNFGMFATAEGPETRLVRCIVIADDDERPIECPDELGAGLIRVKGVPRADNVEVLAERFAKLVDSRALGPSNATAVRVELWQFRFDRQASQAVFDRRLVADVELDGGRR